MEVKRKRLVTTNEVLVPRNLRPDEWVDLRLLFQFGVLNTTIIEKRSLTDKKRLVLTLGTHGPDFDSVMNSAIRKLLLSDAELSPVNQLIILENIVVHTHNICSPKFWSLWQSSQLEKDGKDSATRWRNSYSDIRSLLFERRRLFILSPNPWILFKSMDFIFMIDGVRTGFYTQAVTTTKFADVEYNPDCFEDKLKATRHQFYGLYDITELSEGGCLVEAVDVPVPKKATIRKHMVHKNPWIELFYYFELLATKCFELARSISENKVNCSDELYESLTDVLDGGFFIRDLWVSFTEDLWKPFKASTVDSATKDLVGETFKIFQTFFNVVNASGIHVYFCYFRGRLSKSVILFYSIKFHRK